MSVLPSLAYLHRLGADAHDLTAKDAKGAEHTRLTSFPVIPRWSEADCEAEARSSQCGGPMNTTANRVLMGGPDKSGHDDEGRARWFDSDSLGALGVLGGPMGKSGCAALRG